MTVTHDLQQLCQAQGTAQISVSKAGELIFDQRYIDSPIDVFAVQKGIVSILIGIAEARYFLERVDAMNHIIDPEWTQLSKPDEASLTVEILMNMTTGMDETLRQQGRTGTDWAYNNVAYQKLKEALSVQTGLELNTLTQQWLFEPLSITDSSWITRPEDDAGHAFSALQTTADALRRVGEALLQDQLVDSFYREALGTPSSSTNPAWHLLWWNNQAQTHMRPGVEQIFPKPLLPHAPSDLISARGAGGNHLSISADLDLVIAQTIDPTSKRTPPTGHQKTFWDLIQRL
jgi:CubicO group peptidase (beta-lactamase class C family)